MRGRTTLVFIPLLLVAASLAAAPYLTSVRGVAGEPPSLVEQPHLLYRHDRTSFYYTSADLLHPEAFGPPGAFIDAIVFDIFATGEGVTRPFERMTWFTRSWAAIAGSPQPSSVADIDAAEAFRAAVGGPPRAPRGDAIVIPVAAAAYRERSGVQQIAALAIRAPDAPPPADGAPQQFGHALARAFDGLRSAGVEGVGIPRMAVVDRIGQQQTSRTESWERILSAAGSQGVTSGMRTILFGGWGVDPVSRAATDDSFRAAWRLARPTLQQQARDIAHERFRLGAVIAFAALCRWRLLRRPVGWTRALALALLAPGLAVAIAEGARWLAPALTGLPVALLFAAEFGAALAAGVLIEAIVTFDPKRAVTEGTA